MKKRIAIIGSIIAILIIAFFAAPNMDTTRLSGMISDTETQQDVDEITVFGTKTGKCFHVSGCSCLRSSSIPMTYGEAKAKGLEPCSRCNAAHWVDQ